MRLPLTLSLYIARHFLAGIALALFGITLLIGLIDLVELLRRATGKEGVPFGKILEMVLMTMPQRAEAILPFTVLIGGMLALMRLTRSHELVVARAAGISVWQFLTPAMLLVFTIGVFQVTAFNPLSAVMSMRFDRLEGKYLTGRPSLLSVSASGLWIRQVEENNPDIKEYIIHAQHVSQQDMTLSNVILFVFSTDNKFTKRLDARTAKLIPRADNHEKGQWYLQEVVVSRAGTPPETLTDYILPTSISMEQIQESFASPETISFWELPGFITMLEKAGFSALHHKLYWYGMMASPLMLCAMIFIAAAFSLRLPRRGGLSTLIVAGLFSGFLIRLMTNIIQAFGLSGSLPLLLAAFAPAGICILIGMAAMLHLEDG